MAMNKKIKVRFHLANGENYMKWQVKYPDGLTTYVDPMEKTLVMTNAKLCNRPKTAEKIYCGADKTVCAWVACDDVLMSARSNVDTNKYTAVWFNPRKQINWVDNDGNNMDGKEFKLAFTQGRNVFVQ